MSSDTLAGSETHIIKLSNLDQETLGSQYQVIPAVARDGDDVPCARAGHVACPVDDRIAMYGGFSNANSQEPIKEGGRVWLFDPESKHWNHLDVVNERFPSLCYAAATVYGRKLIVHGGYSASPASTEPNTDSWAFDLDSRVWTEMTPLPKEVDGKADMLVSAPPNLAVADDKLYIVAGSADFGSQIYVLDLAVGLTSEWTSLEFPIKDPPTVSPRPRKGAGLVPIKTGLGRTYLLLMLGEKDEASEKQASTTQEAEFWSGLWTLQLPSTEKTPAQAKDLARQKLPKMDSHEAEWAEVELTVQDMDKMTEASGKSHPGPRGYFGCAPLSGKQVVLWGGLNPRGEREGDGWVVDLKI